MSWRDLFYFSKGDRNALIIVLLLIAAGGLLLMLKKSPSTTSADLPPTVSVSQPPQSSTSSTLSDQSGSSSPLTAQPSTSASSGSVSSSSSASPNVSLSEASPTQSSSTQSTARRETTPERIARITDTRPTYARVEKLAAGSTVELNGADTTALKKVPGIGSSFASRIVRFRDILGGFYSVQQLAEVYGIDEERYHSIEPWFTVDASLIRRLPVNTISQDSLNRHPYISYGQARAIVQLRTQKKRLTGWDNLSLMEEFTDRDKQRILPYLSFE
ncbi:MAG: helix-hairpin-helix domain-containing protein [Tannerella sp.]|jgi:DNA uptake protein ComE-like DNA-binding protein|nr:helix-hairpin-helix domain-containing protein [Tannerella sp.]